ncbi:MAG: phosphoglucosamine mutase [Acidobacteriales bacterium]|nr:phosphoglucosamine mutase [Terriglobales bacterium]
MARKLFGTDGIRGVAGRYPLDAVTVNAVGIALGEWAKEHESPAQVLIGMDTRESGPALAAEVAGGLARSGVEARLAGVTTTPGIAWLTRTGPFVAGVMISASHNPYRDNGIKVFDHSGYKLPDETELSLEHRIFSILAKDLHPRATEPHLDESLEEAYLRFLSSVCKTRLDGLDLVVDAANGSASRLAPRLFEGLGARVRTISGSPDGRNINLNCGSLHLEALRSAVVERGAMLGVAFDGDADRAMFVTGSGRIVDGDGVLFLAARELHASGKLVKPGAEPAVVATVMSNIGLEVALKSLGIGLLRSAVGDRYVLEQMLESQIRLGGEQSGHIIFLEHATTGDGLLTALRVFEIGAANRWDLDVLLADFKTYPQVLMNVRVKEKRPFDELPRVVSAIQRAEHALGAHGRVLVRYSGTEPLARVMIEGPEQDLVDSLAGRIAEAIRSELT